MNFQFVALKPKATKYKEIYITEWAWRPIRSMLAIANQLHHDENGQFIVHPEKMREIDDAMGKGIEEPKSCELLGKKMKLLSSDPFIIGSYGMTIDSLDGEWIFTYPPALCTSAMMHKASRSIINSDVEEDQYDTVCSLLMASEKEVSEFTDFLMNCGGFLMP